MEDGLWTKYSTNTYGRLQTRTQYVQLREADLEKKKQYCKSKGEVDNYWPTRADSISRPAGDASIPERHAASQPILKCAPTMLYSRCLGYSHLRPSTVRYKDEMSVFSVSLLLLLVLRTKTVRATDCETELAPYDV